VIADLLVSIIIVTHNNKDDIIDCINSVLQQHYQSFEIIVVDNASTDGTADKIQENFGNNEIVKLIKNPRNDWYTGGNNLGFLHSKGKLIVILNPDLIVDYFWLSVLVESYSRHSNAGIIGSNVLFFDHPERINACANDIHMTGFVFARFFEGDECNCIEEKVAAPSGASFIFSAEKLKAIGREVPFDTMRFVMDCSDADLAIDFLSHGFQCYVAPSSKVFHKFRFKMNPRRLFILESGRYGILGHLRMKTLIMMLPALAVAEFIVWYFVLAKDRRLIKSKIRVQIWLLTHIRDVIRSDNSAAKDLKLIRQMTSEIRLYGGSIGGPHSLPVRKALKVSNQVFGLTRRLLIDWL
jgi:GT2 family glycosyltransferase